MSNEVTGKEERNTRMEKVLKRGARTSSTSHPMRIRIGRESRDVSWAEQRSM